MESFHLDLPAAALAASAEPVFVGHGRTGLTRLLAAGQDVLVSDADGEFHGAVVLDVDSRHGEPVYELHIGARLPVDMVAQRLGDADMLPEHAGLHDVVDLLGELRRAQVETTRLRAL